MSDTTSSLYIEQLIDECCNEAIKKNIDSHLYDKLLELAEALAKRYQCCYCGIGTIDGNYAEDRACWPNGLSKKMRKGEREAGQSGYLLFKAIEEIGNHIVVTYGKDDIEKAINFKAYHERYGDFEFCSIFILRERDESPHGYIQFLSAENPIEKFEDFPFVEKILQLIFAVKLWYAWKDEHSFREDFDFINNISQQTNNVDLLLTKIMEYVSRTFNAGIISYRIPLLVGSDRKPFFYLRKSFIKEDVPNKEIIREEHFAKRLIIEQNEMGGEGELICKNHESPIITCVPKHVICTEGNQSFKEMVINIPIIRDHPEKKECINKPKLSILCEGNNGCTSRFEKYFGIFKLRIFKSEDDPEDEIPDETKTRLANLAKHISTLLNSIVDKQENESLKKFQSGLRDTSFRQMGEFDKQCAEILCKSIGAIACAVYKNSSQKGIVRKAVFPEGLSAFNIGGNETLKFQEKLDSTICGINELFQIGEVKLDNNVSSYVVQIVDHMSNSLLTVPITKKDGTELGTILLLGKQQEGSEKLVSKTYWEQDKKQIEFMVDILGRIEESDSERLTFLQQLSHELRSPITQMVYGNEFLVETYRRNRNEYMGKPIIGYMIGALEDNIRQAMMFKQIIGDVQYIYSLSKGEVSYNLEEVDIKKCILDTIRLFEKSTDSILEKPKQLTFDTQLRFLPTTIFVDRERIKQVFINLIKNAVQYADDHSVITIRYNHNEIRMSHEIDFINYGMGVDQNKGDRLFRLWERGGNAQRLRPGGTGMGLYIVQEIMKAHEGECYIKSFHNPTIFTVRIPIKKQ
jgi:signal transduction histidine kinase